MLRGIFSTYTMDYGGDVLVRHSEGETWALVMKLSKMLGRNQNEGEMGNHGTWWDMMGYNDISWDMI